MTTELTTDPGDFSHVFARNFNTGDAAALVGGFAEDAFLDPGGDQRAFGQDAICAIPADFLAPGLPIVVIPGRVPVAGNLAVVTFDWSIGRHCPRWSAGQACRWCNRHSSAQFRWSLASAHRPAVRRSDPSLNINAPEPPSAACRRQWCGAL
jgi:hypothetical protein